MKITELSAFVERNADNIALSAAVLSGLIVLAIAVHRTRNERTSRRLLALSVALTTGLSADSMWGVSGKVLHLHGPVRAVLFAFGEVALLAAAAMVNEALADLRQIVTTTPDESTKPEMIEAQKVATARRARLFTAAVWGIAIGVGIAATTASTSTAEAAIRVSPPILVAIFWYFGLDRSGLTVARESITSKLSIQRLMVRLGWATPGRASLKEIDRARRLNRLAARLYAYHNTDSGTLANRVADWRLGRADRSANRYLDDAGRRTVAQQLSARYTLRVGTSPDALSALNPWRTELLATPDTRADIGRVIDGEIVGQAAPDRQRRTADSGRTVIQMSDRRVSGAPIQDMAEWLSGQFPDRVPGRGTVQSALRGQFGSCSTERAIQVMSAVRTARAADNGQTDSGSTHLIAE